ncbi:hypothetical protein GA0070606_5974 [Micromonospora citrea]|uniref:Secreted protein n=1 Tax=Micromonospora citrea TaxID=47855 RepID=A0A1C6W0Q1_9ACTN|nr:hypothetical protein [Micromonospora citrea]SCL72159.1 hypothetical protein GA0070606_5974 [Micromonospora citrea]
MQKLRARLAAAAAAAVLVLTGLVVTSAGASASPITTAAPGWENDDVVAASSPGLPSTVCQGGPGGRSCFQKYGDKIWVVDSYTNGRGHYAQWENWLHNGSTWVLYRRGTCGNALTTGVWGYCNKEFYENGTSPNAVGGRGSGIRLYSCDALVGCQGYTWIVNNG